jgi:hypothetical protein
LELLDRSVVALKFLFELNQENPVRVVFLCVLLTCLHVIFEPLISDFSLTVEALKLQVEHLIPEDPMERALHELMFRIALVILGDACSALELVTGLAVEGLDQDAEAAGAGEVEQVQGGAFELGVY